LDKWILARLNLTINTVTGGLDKFDASGAAAEIEKFVDDFSLWYIRRSRDRVGPAKESDKDSNAFYSTTYYVLTTLCKIMAPIAPFLSDEMYINLTKEESVHLSDWPRHAETLLGKPIFDEELVNEMGQIRAIVEKALAKRKETGIPVRQPLAGLLVTNYKLHLKELKKLMMDELNIKEIDFKDGKGEIEVTLNTNLTPELEEESKVRDLVRKIQDERKNMGLNLTQKVDVQIDKLPVNKKLIQWMMKKAQIANLSEGKFSVKKSS
jgi:isoleucyl-tRNA synthetase